MQSVGCQVMGLGPHRRWGKAAADAGLTIGAQLWAGSSNPRRIAKRVTSEAL